MYCFSFNFTILCLFVFLDNMALKYMKVCECFQTKSEKVGGYDRFSVARHFYSDMNIYFHEWNIFSSMVNFD